MMMQQAHLLGQQQRMPTKAEQRAYETNALTIAVLNIAGTARSACLEGKHTIYPDKIFELATAILDKSHESRDDYKDPQKRKMRNQLAAQFVYARCRGQGIEMDPQARAKNEVSDAISIVDTAFASATKLMEQATGWAKEKVKAELDETPSLIT